MPALAALPARLAEGTTWAARFALVDAALLGLLEAAALWPDPEVAWAWAQRLRSGGRGTVQLLAEGTGGAAGTCLPVSGTRSAWPPKPAARVLRFRRAADLLVPYGLEPGHPAGRGIADVAAECGTPTTPT